MDNRKAVIKARKQSGMTIIGFVIVLSMVIFVSYIGMRIVPIYMEYYSVVTAMNGVASERGSSKLSLYNVRAKILSRLYVSYSSNVKGKNITKTRGNGVHVRVAYEVRTPVIGNLDVVAHFDRSVRLSN